MRPLRRILPWAAGPVAGPERPRAQLIRWGLGAFLAGVGVMTGLAQNASAPAPSLSPAHNWALDLFKPEGYRSMTLTGEEVRTIDAEHVKVVNLSIRVFSGDPANRVTSILYSPSATFHAKDESASGTEGVRLIQVQENADITGLGAWTYIQAGEKISIHGGVKVILNAQLNDLLK